ncbi:MAG: hypothetical protein WAX66_02460 [Patescibacteria group bacterium]
MGKKKVMVNKSLKERIRKLVKKIEKKRKDTLIFWLLVLVSVCNVSLVALVRFKLYWLGPYIFLTLFLVAPLAIMSFLFSDYAQHTKIGGGSKRVNTATLVLFISFMLMFVLTLVV